MREGGWYNLMFPHRRIRLILGAATITWPTTGPNFLCPPTQVCVCEWWGGGGRNYKTGTVKTQVKIPIATTFEENN